MWDILFILFCHLYVNLHYAALYKEYHSLKSKARDGGEYHSLKSKMHNGGNASCFGTDSRNSVFGAHLNKEKSLKGKKSTFSSANTKTLTWSKHNGWTTYQSVRNDSTTPQNDYQEVCISYIC